ncbi:MAG: VanZ family protein [Ignavibacteriales bacterium]|nr:VanZ family protein [Ignavibacteriales bacterium]
MLKLIKEKRIFFVYTPLVLYWIVLFIATSLSTQSLPKPFVFSDKVAHLLAYLILSFFVTLTLWAQEKFQLLKRRYFFFTITIVFLYGVFDEIHQSFIPGRSCEFLDWVADATGAIIGTLIATLLIVKIKKIVEKGTLLEQKENTKC